MPRTAGSGSEPAGTLRSQHAEATRRAVLDAARRVFGRKGYAQASLDEIAAAARVTKGAVYHHFAGKEALFRAVHTEVEAEAQTRAAAAVSPAQSPLDQMIAAANGYLDVALDEEIRRITLIDGPALLGLEPEGPTEQQPGFVAARLFIANAIARGQVIDFDPGVLAHLLAGLMLQGGLIIARSDDPDATRAMLGPALEAMLRGLAPGKGD
jgi:AcrR family transcriptional regulator